MLLGNEFSCTAFFIAFQILNPPNSSFCKGGVKWIFQYLYIRKKLEGKMVWGRSDTGVSHFELSFYPPFSPFDRTGGLCQKNMGKLGRL